MNSINRLVFGALTLGTLAITTNASAFCRTYFCPDEDERGASCNPNPQKEGCYGGANDKDVALYWPQSCVGFSLNKKASKQVSLTKFKEVTNTAFSSWQNVTCDGKSPTLKFFGLDDVDCDAQEYNKDQGNANLIVFRDEQWPYANGDTVLALTTLTFNTDTGEIYDADMELNSANHNFTTTDNPDLVEDDLLAVVTHETGHFIGMAHSPHQDATMYAVYPEPGFAGDRTFMRSLSQDDIDAICSVYPPTRTGLGECNPEPRHGFSDQCFVAPAADEGCSISQTNAQSSKAFYAWGVVGSLLGAAMVIRRRVKS